MHQNAALCDNGLSNNRDITKCQSFSQLKKVHDSDNSQANKTCQIQWEINREPLRLA